MLIEAAPVAVSSFPPSLGGQLRLLILGSMPGVASLRAVQYYAHPRNLFWPLMGELFGAGPDLPYPTRTAALHAQGIGLWDVLASCDRPGSLDARIRRSSEIANDLPGLLLGHPELRGIAVNGALARDALHRHHPGLAAQFRVVELPSTSPANASLPLQQKRTAWAQLRELLPRGLSDLG